MQTLLLKLSDLKEIQQTSFIFNKIVIETEITCGKQFNRRNQMKIETKINELTSLFNNFLNNSSYNTSYI